MKSPKLRFLANQPAVDAHNQIANSAAVLVSLDTALAQMVHVQPSGDNPARSWDAHNRLEGAKTFIDIWLSLGQPPAQPQTRPSTNLKPV